MSSTTATASAPRPVEAGTRPTPDGVRAGKDKPQGADIFSSLLNLLSSTRVEPQPTATAATTAQDRAPGDPANPDGDDNPLAFLPGWVLPVALEGLSGKASGPPMARAEPGLPGTAGLPEHAATLQHDGQIDISGMTPVEPAALDTPKGAVALPANALRPGTASATFARAVEAAPGSAAAPPWRHASLAGTETGAIQQAGTQALSLRSTVALNDRFGATPGVPLTGTEPRETTAEAFGLAAPASASGRAPEWATLPGSTAGGESGAGTDNSGHDAGTHDQNNAGADQPRAPTDTGEEPTVTHWGTQHLRHASLRVAGEAGDQAIDIQLSMQGQEVQVAFMTENAEARASLRESAGESLADLLNKSGMQLGGVSVGSQGQRGSRGEGGEARPRSVAPASNPSTAAPVSQARTAPRADGSQPLDVFA